MLTPYRQKYNPKKPKSKIKLFASSVQVFSKKKIHEFKKSVKTPRIGLKSGFLKK